MDYSFRQFIEQNYMDKLIAAAEEFIECDTRYEIEVTVKCVLIEDIDYSPLKQGKDFVRFPLVLHASTMALDNGESYRREVFLRGMLSGSFSLRFADIDVHCSSASSNYYGRFKRTYTDDLLPITKKDEVEKDAEAFLNCVLRFAECSPGRIDTIAFAGALGIRVYFAQLSDDHSVRAEFFFNDTDKVMYDKTINSYRTYHIPAKTILVERSLCKRIESLRFTIMHELVHAVLQKYTFLLANMYDPGFVSFFCPIRLEESNQFVDPFTERMERYADMIASRALMPQTMFKSVVEKKLRDCGCLRTPQVLHQVLEETAKEFGVSVAACRRRFLSLGYTMMRGISKYVDGSYVPPYCFYSDALDKNQTFTVSIKLAQEILKKNPKLTKMMMKGRLRFIEHHFVVADPKYVTKNMQLTEYAREHLDECAVKIDLVYPAGYYSNSRFELRDDEKLN